MSVDLFSSQRMQGDKCGICYSDDHEDLGRLGPIVNHLVDKHSGFHTRCLNVWLLMQETCPTCRGALNVGSFSLGKKQINSQMSVEMMLKIMGAQATIFLVMLAAVVGGVYMEIFDLATGVISTTIISQIFLVIWGSQKIFRVMQERSEEVRQAILDLE